LILNEVNTSEECRVEIFIMMKLQNMVFWGMTSCSDASIFTLKVVAARSSKILISKHITTQHHNPEDHDLNTEEST
jgi:hypothetical protein